MHVQSRNLDNMICRDCDTMPDSKRLDGMAIAPPSRLHFVFENPFFLDWADYQRLTETATGKRQAMRHLA